MKTMFYFPVPIYIIAGFASLAIMMIIDFLLGAEAEHLNAWVIINRLFGNDLGLPDSLAIKKFGLYGATLLMLVSNLIFGFILIHIFRAIIKVTQIVF